LLGNNDQFIEICISNASYRSHLSKKKSSHRVITDPSNVSDYDGDEGFKYEYSSVINIKK